MEPTVRSASPADVVALAKALGRAFHDDAAMRFIFPDDHQRERRLQPMFDSTIRRFHLQDANTDVAVRGGEVVAGALWSPPGRWKPGFWRSLRAAPKMMRVMGSRVRAGQQVMDTVATLHPPEPHWYLACLGTDPDAQGTGAGSALLRSRLDRFDGEGLTSHLETSKEANVAYYERFGFKLNGEAEIPDGPRFWAMTRPPGGSAAL